jgi:GTP cyclohydrolase II
MMPMPQSVRRIVYTRLPTKSGLFQLVGYQRELAGKFETALALSMGDLTKVVPLLRIHSQCFTGEILGSLRCDCREQLEISMEAIATEGCGLVIYEHQEGRGIGLMAKLQAYALQDEGMDTVEANHALGFDADCRDFALPIAILRDLNISQVRLLSNNPKKHQALIQAGIAVPECVSCETSPNIHALSYLRTKKVKMGHALKLV